MERRTAKLVWGCALAAVAVFAHCTFTGCQHPDGRREAAATDAAITNADAANGRAQAHNAAARTLTQQIADDAAQLLSSK